MNTIVPDYGATIGREAMVAMQRDGLTKAAQGFSVWGTPAGQHLWSFTGWASHWFTPEERLRNLAVAAAMLADIERRKRVDDVIWVPCRGCTDLAGCEERWECLTLGVTGRNNCATCDHKKHPDGGHCYMFRTEPDGVCMKHTVRTRGVKASHTDQGEQA